MWASSWRKRENETVSQSSDKYLKNSLYCMTAKIDTGLLADNSEFDDNIKKFARKFDMKITDLEGSVEIAERSYLAARNNDIK